MKKEIGILIVEDTPAFVVKINRELRRAGLSFRSKRVKTKEAFVHELACHRPDVILSNGGLPSFDGFMALAIAGEKRPDVPLIFVTGSPDEEGASGDANSAHSRQGAPFGSDHVLSSPLSKLAPTVRRALREAKERARLREMELRVLTARWLAR